MPRDGLPKYRRHSRGYAFVQHRSIPTKDHRLYLGKYNSPESLAKYRAFLTKLAEGVGPPIPVSYVPEIQELVALYLMDRKKYFQREDGIAYEYRLVCGAMRPLLELFATDSPSSFGPRSLVQVRSLLAKSYARSTANHHLSRIKAFWRWACENELCPPDTYHKLLAVRGLYVGQDGCRETEKVRPAPVDEIEALVPFVSPTVAAMVRVQFYCGLRPGEVCRLRMCDVDTSEDIWLYRPSRHKTAWRNIQLTKAIPVTAQKIIRPFIRDDPSEYLFKPAEAKAWAQREMLDKLPPRKTKRYPCEVKRLAEERRRRKRLVKRRAPGECYTAQSYRGALDHGFDKAEKAGVKIERFTPNQIRHAIVSYVSQAVGHQAAQRWAGHESLAATDIYTKSSIGELASIARRLDTLWSSL